MLLEWNAENTSTHQSQPETLLDFAHKANYQVYSVPNLAEIHTAQRLAVQMCLTESFIFYPNENTSPF